MTSINSSTTGDLYKVANLPPSSPVGGSFWITMTDLQVHTIQAQSQDEMSFWHNPEERKAVIAGAIDKAKDVGARMVRILDHEGQQLYIEGFGPRLWDLVHEAHERLEAEVAEVRKEAKTIHALIQEALNTFESGQIVASHALIKRAIDLECELFGDCPCSGDERLLEAFGYDDESDQEDPCAD